ncbi:MAG: hypothetical protein J5787_09240 [Alphaproteobacteria bacterium]|nr:hypothetical protein [Alphaproteobacteria bacterium]MBO4643836.1 hypothetical protein [Alphaproteobacteria bacterium]
MPEYPLIMINDFLDTEVRGVFTTQYVEPNEMLLLHNLSGLKVKIVKEPPTIATYLFSFTNGWVEVQREHVSGQVTFIPMMLPKIEEEIEAAKREASVEEYRKYNGLRYLKNLAILLGENPEEMDSVMLELP